MNPGLLVVLVGTVSLLRGPATFENTKAATMSPFSPNSYVFGQTVTDPTVSLGIIKH